MITMIKRTPCCVFIYIYTWMQIPGEKPYETTGVMNVGFTGVKYLLLYHLPGT